MFIAIQIHHLKKCITLPTLYEHLLRTCLCHVKIVPGAKIVPAYVIVCLHPDNLPGNRRRDAENMFPNDEIT